MRKITQDAVPLQSLLIRQPNSRWTSLLREALYGSQQDFTEGSIGRAIVRGTLGGLLRR